MSAALASLSDASQANLISTAQSIPGYLNRHNEDLIFILNAPFIDLIIAYRVFLKNDAKIDRFSSNRVWWAFWAQINRKRRWCMILNINALAPYVIIQSLSVKAINGVLSQARVNA